VPRLILIVGRRQLEQVVRADVVLHNEHPPRRSLERCAPLVNAPPKVYVDAQIDLSPLNDTNEVNDAHTIAATVQQDDSNTALGQVFDVTANIGVDAVVAKGGPNGNLCLYNPEASGDTGLHAPLNAQTRFFGLSHFSFHRAISTDTRSLAWEPDQSL
jgi:hypothetical protein